MGTPPLPYRVRPPQVLLGVGAVLLVSAGATLASAHGGPWARALLLVLAVVAAAVSVLAARARLRSAPEVLAATAAALALAGSASAGISLDGEPVTAAGLAGVFLGLHLVSRRVAAWPLASWAAAQIAVLRTLDDVPEALHTATYLTVALVGLAGALFARPLIGRLAIATTAPWWVAGVVTGIGSAWSDTGVRPWLSVLLVLGAAAGLLLARLRAPLDPLLGPPRAVPVVAGVVSGVAAVGPISALGPVPVAVTGFMGVLLATVPPSVLTGWRRGLFEPVAVTAGVVVSGLCVVQLAVDGRWAALSLLLLLTALPTAGVAARRPDERPVTLPTAVGCLAASVLLALPDGILGAGVAAALLTTLYAVAMVVGSALDPGSRLATARAAALAGVAAVAVLAAEGDRPALAVHLALQGAFTLGWAWRTGARDAPLAAAAWRVAAGQLVLAAWVGAATAGLAAVEWYSLPAAAGLLIAAGRGLAHGRSWPAWGPGLLVAAVPSAVLAVVTSDGARAVAVLIAASVALVVGARTGLRAPLMIGAFTALWLAVGFAVRALPWPLGTALVVGSLLLALGTRRERRPVAGFGARLADLR
ncbi:hypothetical protein GCM10010531_11450 [Blastococcus jejuensis]|uniref:Uncharacterized protein n=1 Tax=Blastococcus jejuensis TaxID=351224 RepID=A0ABP6NYC2_9ACTN